MAIITTENLSNPKPVRGVNWCGNPMGPNESYWGDESASNEPAQEPVAAAPKARVKRRNRVSAWTAEKRAAYSERMRQWHAARKAGTARPGPET